jgi:SGNH hydrolase-like domain, acetyltransferase AlgX
VSRLANLGLASASVVATLLAMEGALRVARWLGRDEPATGTTLADYSEHDPLLGWRKRPGTRLRFHRREYDLEMSINSLGLRDPERGYDAPSGTLRILALGDSFIEGYTVPLEETATQVLETLLRRDGCRAEVVNGATTGYSTDQEYLFYRTEGVKYSPRIVVLFFYYNDVLYNDLQFYTGGVQKPVFVFRDGGLALYRSPLPPPPPAPKRPEAGEADPDGSPRSRSSSSSALVDFVRERLWFGAPRLYNALGRTGLWPPNRPVGARMEMRVYQRGRLPEIEGGWQKTAVLLDTLAREVASHGARFLVAYVPNRMEVSDQAWRLSRSRYGMDDVGWDRALVRRRLEQIARAAGIPVLDLTPALKRAEGLFGGPYYTYDGHWNAEGHRIAAEEVRRTLESEGWLQGCGATAAAPGPVDSTRIWP